LYPAVNPGNAAISSLARNNLPEYYLVLAASRFQAARLLLGVDGLRPAVKTRSTTIAPGLCAAVLTAGEAPELFLLA
jgi:hypothetical protein